MITTTKRRPTIAKLTAEMASVENRIEGIKAMIEIAEGRKMECELDSLYRWLDEMDSELMDVMAQAVAFGYTPEDFEG